MLVNAYKKIVARLIRCSLYVSVGNKNQANLRTIKLEGGGRLSLMLYTSGETTIFQDFVKKSRKVDANGANGASVPCTYATSRHRYRARKKSKTAWPYPILNQSE